MKKILIFTLFFISLKSVGQTSGWYVVGDTSLSYISIRNDTFFITSVATNWKQFEKDKDRVIRLDADYTLTNSGAEQKLFNSSTNGRVTVPTGTYFFESVFSISAMSATSGNAAFDILGAGTATLGTVLYHITGVDGNTATAATQTGSTVIQGQSPASMVTAGTGTTLNASIRGTFEVTAAGTIQPSVTLVTAAAAVVRAGSYFRGRKIGGVNFLFYGEWD